MKKSILVTGGAGYIGSHFCYEWKKLTNLAPVVYDNLSTGHRDLARFGPFILGDILETEKLARVIKEYKIDILVHFAGKAIVPESVSHPQLYRRNNVEGTRSVLTAMAQSDCHNLIFSSSCTVYGKIKHSDFCETQPLKPLNPYGESKWLAETAILEHSRSHPHFAAVILRYFNVIGQNREAGLYEKHQPETHLVPNVLNSIQTNSLLTLHGNCERDFIDVRDVAKAHYQAINHLTSSKPFTSNLGSGIARNLDDVLSICEKALGKTARVQRTDLRPGDVHRLVANPQFFKSWYREPLISFEESIQSIISDPS